MFRGRTAYTITAGDVYDHMVSRLRERWSAAVVTETVGFDLTCAVCGYNLRGLSPAHACPECGTALEFEAHVWHGVCRVLSASLGVPAQAIRRESRLVKDLGASF